MAMISAVSRTENSALGSSLPNKIIGEMNAIVVCFCAFTGDNMESLIANERRSPSLRKGNVASG